MNPEMDADELLDSMRCLLLVVLRDGTIAEARGGFGGFLGLDLPSLPGSNVFNFVPTTDAEELALYFIENVDATEETIALPLPFRMSVVDAKGFAHPVDIVPTGQVVNGAEWLWTVLLMPVSLNGSITRSLDLEMSGAPREVVKTMLCEELRVDNANYTSRWLMIDFSVEATPDVVVARPEDQFAADIVASDLHSEQWQPWSGVERGEVRSLALTSFPPGARSMMESQGWNRSLVAPVFVHDQLAAVYLLVGNVPSNYDPLTVKRNVASRIQTLVRATAMLIGRWGDQDLLRIAATTDELTGLDNRRELFSRIDAERRGGSLLYVDVDGFKAVNDRFGHVAGDAVLIEISRRIQSVCRPQDRIGRVGGDEFVVVLPGADNELASTIAQRIIERVAEPLAIADQSHEVSVSIGHASLDADNPLDAADHAMLQAKREGRGRHLMASLADG